MYNLNENHEKKINKIKKEILKTKMTALHNLAGVDIQILNSFDVYIGLEEDLFYLKLEEKNKGAYVSKISINLFLKIAKEEKEVKFKIENMNYSEDKNIIQKIAKIINILELITDKEVYFIKEELEKQKKIQLKLENDVLELNMDLKREKEINNNKKEEDLRIIFKTNDAKTTKKILDDFINSNEYFLSFIKMRREKENIVFEKKTIEKKNNLKLCFLYNGWRISKKELYKEVQNGMVNVGGDIIFDLEYLNKIGIKNLAKNDRTTIITKKEFNMNDLLKHFKAVLSANKF